MNTQKLVRVSLLCAISVVLVYFVHFPLIPGVTFLEYDPADISIILIGLSYGTGWGLAATLIVSVIQGITVSASSGWIGIVMHLISTGIFVSVISICHKKTHKLIFSLVFGALSVVLVMIPMNLVFTGIFMGTGVMTVVKMLIPAIIPFNLLKAGINVAVAGILYKRMTNYLHID